MSRFAELPDGRRLEFPDDTPDEVIQAAVRRELGLSVPLPAVTTPESDQKAPVTPVSAPIEAELRPGGPRGATGEAILAVGSGAIAEPLSGLAGLFGAITGVLPGGETPLERAARFQAGTAEALTFEPRSEAGVAATESISRGAEFLTKQVRKPVGGIAGLIQLAAGSGVEGAAETVRRTVEEGIGPTAGAALERAGAPPIISAAAEIIPTGIAVVAGAKQLPKPKPKPKPRPKAEPEPVPEIKPARSVAEPEAPAAKPRVDEKADVSSQKIVDDLKKGKTEPVASEVVPDAQVVEAAQRLGVDLNVEHYATSTAFQDVARALKTKPGSELLANEVQALRDLGTRADDLVSDIGGSIDKAAVSDDILNSTRAMIDDLQTKADGAYKTVRETIHNKARVKTDNISEFLQKKIDDFGGDDSLLSVAEQRIKKIIGRAEDGSITYAALDRIRRDVGDGFNKRSGPFADDGQRTLRELYDVLSDTQQGAAEAFGIGPLYTEAKGLVSRRKGIEDQAVQLFGKNATASLTPRIRAAATGLPKGDVTALNKLMAALPEARRGEVAATVLGELFGAGSRQGGALGTGFATTWRNLNRNKAARGALLKHLPEGTGQRLDDIGRVMDAIVRSNAKPLANPSGTAAGIIAALETGEAGSRLFAGTKAVASTVALEGIAVGVGIPPGVVTTARATAAVVRRKKGPDVGAVKAADDLLSSQTFKDAVGEAVQGNTAKANKIIEGSPKFKRWATTLTDAEAARLARVGFIGYVSGEE